MIPGSPATAPVAPGVPATPATRQDGLLAKAGPGRSERAGRCRAPLQAATSWALLGMASRRAAAAGTEGTLLLTEGAKTRRLGRGEPVVRVEVHDRRAYTSLLTSGSVGLGRSYVAGWWDADDLGSLVRVLLRWTEPLRGALDTAGRKWGWFVDLASQGRGPGRVEDRRNIASHYDLSNEFFELMLDPTMTYSCAIFPGPTAPLATAQETKIARLCRRLDLQPTDHLLEIGSGWGGLAVHAAKHYGCRVTTTTISAAQREYAAKRVAEAGLTGRVEVLGDDWRDLDGSYDKLVSVEMIEAVDWRHHDEFLSKCGALVRPRGLAVLQAIVIDDKSFERAKHHQDFVRRMVFPGGCIPSVTSIITSVSRATDMRVLAIDDIGPHYAETLKRWEDNLRHREDDVRALGFTPQFRRLWALYLAYCRAAFLERHISDVQIVLAKPAWRGNLTPMAAL